jgi:TPR repeat protein
MKNIFKRIANIVRAYYGKAIAWLIVAGIAYLIIWGIVNWTINIINSDKIERAKSDYDLAIEFLEKGDYDKAKKYFESSALVGNATAKQALGRLYYIGFIVPADTIKALKLLKDSEKKEKNTLTEYWIGNIYEEQKEYKKAFKWYHKAAGADFLAFFDGRDNRANPYAQFELACMYESGQGMKQNITKSTKWFRKVAKNDDYYFWKNNIKSLQNTLDNLLFFEIPDSTILYDEYFLKFVNKGHAVAQIDFGMIYLKQANFTEAEKYLFRSLSFQKILEKENPNDFPAGLCQTLTLLSYTNNELKNYPVAIQYIKSCNDLLLRYKDLIDNKPYLAQNYGNLSWYYLFTKEYAKSEQSARQALELDSTSIAKTNLAHALLFQNRFSEAEIIYRELELSQTIIKDNETYTQAFLDDFDEFEKAVVIPEEHKADVEKIRKILK